MLRGAGGTWPATLLGWPGVRWLQRAGLGLASALLVACSTGPVVVRPGEPMPLPDPSPMPWPSSPGPRPSDGAPLPLPVPAPAPRPPPPAPPPYPVPPAVPDPAPPPPSLPAPPLGAEAVRALALQLLPPRIEQRRAWADDIATSFAALGIPAQPHKVCALAAVIEQESGWQADPPVANLSRIAKQELDKKRARYGIPGPVLALALRKTSPDGRSYQERLDRLRTERELSDLFDDMLAEIPLGAQMLGQQNPVRTGGSTQVSIGFAAERLQAGNYPWRPHGSARQEVFKRRGGVYFGAAMLLDYPVSYNRMVYRFADYNAGRYASRNAAVQSLVARLSGQAIAPDGDLLRYRDGEPLPAASAPSQTWQALNQLPGLGLPARQIERDLRLEKQQAFERSPTYLRLYALAAQRAWDAPRERLPDIALSSPKITRPLTTAWFAERCETRYRACLARLPPAPGADAAEQMP